MNRQMWAHKPVGKLMKGEENNEGLSVSQDFTNGERITLHTIYFWSRKDSVIKLYCNMAEEDITLT